MSAAGSPLANLIVRFIADSQPFLTGIQQASDAIEGFSDKLSSFAKTFATALPFAAIGADAFHAADDFENASALIARSTGASGEKLGELENSFKSLFQQSTLSATELAGGLGLIQKETQTTGDQLESLTVINSNLAKVTGQSLTPTIQETQAALKQFGITAAEQPAALDAMFALTQKTGISIAALSSGLQSAGPVLKTLGLNFDQSAALLANFEEHGVSSEKVVAALNKGLVQFAQDGIKQPEVAMQAFIDRITQAQTPMDALNIVTETFGKRGGVFFADAARSGALAIGDLTKVAEDSGGSINKTADTTKTLSDRLTQMAHAADVALLPLGKPLVAALEQAVASVTPLITGAGELATSFTEFSPKLAALTAGLLAASPVVILATKYFSALSEAVAALRIPTVLSFSIAGAPIAPFIAALGVTAIQLDQLQQKYDAFNDDLKSKSILDALQQGKTVDGLKQMGFSLDDIKKAVGGFDSAKQTFADLGLGITLVTDSVSGLKGVAGPTAEEIKKAFADLGLKDVPKAIADIQKSFAIVSASGVLTAAQLRDAFESTQLKIVSLNDSLSKSPFKALGIDTTQLDVAKKALELITQDVLAGRSSMDELAAAQENYTKQVQGSELGLNRIEIALSKAGVASQLLNFDSLIEQVTVAQKVVAGFAGAFDPAKEDVDAAAKLVNTLADNLQKVGPSAAPLRESLREVQLQMSAIQSTTLFQNDPFLGIRSSTDALVEHMLQLQAASLSVEATLHDLGQKTPQEVADGIKQTQDAIDKMNAAVAVGIPGALQAVQGLYRNLTAEQIAALNAQPFHDFGVKSQAELELLATQAQRDFEDIQNTAGVTSTDIARSWVAMIQKLEQAGIVFNADTVLLMQNTQRQISNTAAAAALAIDAQVKGAVNDISQAIGQIILEGKDWADTFEAVGTKIGEEIISGIINHELQGTIKIIDNLILKFGQWLGIISDAGTAAAKTATQVATIATPPFSTTSGIPGIGSGGAGGGAGAAAGSAAGGVLGLVNVVTGAITAISSVIGNFQMAREEGTLNAIEQHTKVIAITLAGISAPWEQVPEGQATISDALKQLSSASLSFDTWKDATLIPAIQAITDTLTKVLKPIFLDMDAVLHVLMIPGGAPGAGATTDQATALLAYSTFSNTQITSGLGELSTDLEQFSSSIVGALLTQGGLTRATIFDATNNLGAKVDGVTNGIRDKLDEVFRPFGAISDVLNSIGGVGGALGGILGGAGSAISSIGTSLVGGLLGAFGIGQGGEKDRLSIIANSTSYLAWVFSAGGGHDALLNIQNGMANLVASVDGWLRDDLNDLWSVAVQIKDIQAAMVTGAAGTGGQIFTGNTFNFNIDGGGDPQAIAEAIAAKLKLRSPVFA